MDSESPAVIHLVPHTHWDREWYEPFQVFRMRLVELVDQLLDAMEADDRLAFTLDGQVATVDDYLEVRPEGRPRIERLIAAGRLAIGPWQILMDEFLVSAETMIRNLEIGWQAAEAYGAAMPVGYLPDMFGHVAQMPQILRRAGIRHAVVWRGVPAAIDRHAFTWRSPDGSSVRAEYLVGGYGNGAYLLAIPDRLAEKVGRYVDASREFYGDRSILAMYGTDHAVPSPRLASIVAEANARQPGVVVRIETLTEYIRAFDAAVADPAEPDPAVAPSWTGELRSAARANMLMNVTSARIDIKQAAARAERALERYAEPFAALHGQAWPGRLLELAWRRAIDNSAHDSICGCSRDEVVDQVLTRFAEAEQIGRGIVDAALRGLAADAPRGSVVVANPSPVGRTDVVEVEVDVPAVWDAVELEMPDGSRVVTQLVERPETVLRRLRLMGRQVPELFARRLHGRELFGHSLDGHLISREGGGPQLVLLMDDPASPADFDVDTVIDSVAAATADAPEETWDVTVVRGDRRRLAAAVPVPALGATVVRARERDPLPTAPANGADGSAGPLMRGTVVVTDRSLTNGLVSVEIAADGTTTIEGGGMRLAGVGRLVDGGDFGDTYNYGPPAADRIVAAPTVVVTKALEHGPVRGAVDVVARYDWPVGLTADGSTRTDVTAPVEVTTRLELRTGEPFVRVAVSFTNPARDHRVRYHIPLPAPVDRSAAEGQLAVVERGLTAEAGHGEVPLPTFPAHGFVHVSGVSVLLEHVSEYEVVDGRELALTVLRSTGLISRNDNPFREDPAGPEVPVPDAQLVGPWRFGFAVMPHRGGWQESGVSAAAETFHLPFATAVARGAADAEPLETTGLSIEGGGVVLSALRRRNDELEVRIVAETAEPTTASLRFPTPIAAARDVDLLGRRRGDIAVAPDGSVAVPLSPWEIRTVRLTLART